MWGDMGDKLRDQARQELGNVDALSNAGSPQEGEPTIHRHPCGETMRAMGDNGSNGRHWETVGDKGRQDFAKAVTPSNTGIHIWADNGETRPRQGEHTFQRKLTCATIWETRRDKRTHHPTQAHICGKTMGDHGRQDLGKADAASGAGTHVGDNGTQAETGADKTSGRRTHHPTPSIHVTKQLETGGDKPQEDGHTIQHRHTCAETMRGNHPTQTHMWGGNGRQEAARPRDGGRTFQRRLRYGETLGDKGRQDLGKADAPSVGRQ